jgi:uncharacterized membrane protein
MQQAFSIEESLWFGWEKTRKHSRLIFQAVLALFAVQVMQAIVAKVLEGTLLGIAANIVLVVVSVILSTGVLVISLRIAQGKRVKLGDLIPPGQLVWWYVCASALAGIIILAGFIALIIPGIYFALRFSMVRFAIVDGAEITESLKKSSVLTEGVKWRLLGFMIVTVALNVVGALFFLVGLLITLPVTMIAYAHIYLKLQHHVEAK